MIGTPIAKTEAKTRHSGTVKIVAAIIFAPFSSTDFSTVTEVCIRLFESHATVLRLTGYTVMHI